MLDGLALSIYDGETEYRIGQTVLHPHGDDHAGGLYVSDTIEGCLRRDANMFPAEVRVRNERNASLAVLSGLETWVPRVEGWRYPRALPGDSVLIVGPEYDTVLPRSKRAPFEEVFCSRQHSGRQGEICSSSRRGHTRTHEATDSPQDLVSRCSSGSQYPPKQVQRIIAALACTAQAPLARRRATVLAPRRVRERVGTHATERVDRRTARHPQGAGVEQRATHASVSLRHQGNPPPSARTGDGFQT